MPRTSKTSRYRVLRGFNWAKEPGNPEAGENRAEPGDELDAAALTGVDIDQEVADGVLEPAGGTAAPDDGAVVLSDPED